jgi:hypothetical protein
MRGATFETGLNIFTHSLYSTLVYSIYMNLWLELDNWPLHVAQLVRARQLDSVAQLVRARQLDSIAQLVRARQLDSVAQLVRARQLSLCSSVG